MRKPNTEQFTGRKPDKLNFKGEDIDKKPPKDSNHNRTSGRPDADKDPVKQSSTSSREDRSTAHVIQRPDRRRKVRHPFNFYEDQIEALKTIQRAQTDLGQGTPHLADLAQDAFDDYINRTVRSLPNLEISSGKE